MILIILKFLSDNELAAYTTYEYSVSVSNSVGSSQSDYSRVTTEESVPQGVQSPQWSVNPAQLDTITLSWRSPSFPNGKYMSASEIKSM